MFSANVEKSNWKPIDQWMPLPTDEPKNVKPLNKEEVETIMKRLTQPQPHNK